MNPCCILVAVLMLKFHIVSTGFYTLHQEKVSFESAMKTCLTEGVLTSMASQKEVDSILNILSTSLSTVGNWTFWVGLWKPKGSCPLEDLPLRGFMWTADNRSEAEISQWKKPPMGTCTNIRCGLLSVYFDAAQLTEWGWADASCAGKNGFICKREDESSISPHQPAQENAPQLTSPPSMATSPDTVNNVRDKYNIFIPVLVALLVLVVLVVVVLGVFKCCFQKQLNTKISGKKAGKTEEMVDLHVEQVEGKDDSIV
ncbi:C-type lectin domain family 14 member A-like [Megalops cyprinoides]|uniref:C-type lectin domain family 14 member A-like n=1 Tax=Megalops cyprinoides TaxID=118141 RepID=UPI0018643F73|nr:C-type lectin domain family 14 member A-like [Megalops cyprinoides]